MSKAFDTTWGIAAEVPLAELTPFAARCTDNDEMWTALTGENGMTALLFGNDEADEVIAKDVARDKQTKVWLLDFHDEAPSIIVLDGKKRRHLRTHPATFLRERGIVAPGYEPRPSTPIRFAHVIVGATPDAARRYYENPELSFLPHAEGALVLGYARGGEEDWAKKVPGPVYTLAHDPRNGRFWVYVEQRGEAGKYFSTPPSEQPVYEPVEEIRGASDPIGICQALGVDPRMLELKTD